MAQVRISEIVTDGLGRGGKVLLDNGDELIGVYAITSTVKTSTVMETTLTFHTMPKSGGMHLLLRNPERFENPGDYREVIVEDHGIHWENETELYDRKQAAKRSQLEHNLSDFDWEEKKRKHEIGVNSRLQQDRDLEDQRREEDRKRADMRKQFDRELYEGN